MSNTPTVFEGITPANRPSKDKSPTAATRRETSRADGDSVTRREAGDSVPARQTRRLHLPPTVRANYDYIRDLPTSGGEADIALLQAKASGEQVILKYYRTGVRPDPVAMRILLDPATRDLDQANRHLVRILAFVDDAHGTWELQEYCALGSLHEWAATQGGRLSKETLRAVLSQTAEALRYLHGLGSGIAHRDLKPANVLVRAEEPLVLVLTDFGLAKAQQSLTHLTTSVKGTWHYAAPEVHSKLSSTKSDWFSLGAIIFELYTGRRLFAMADGGEVSEDDARARCIDHNYSTDLIDDARWKLLADGLLTWERDHRWGADQVEGWLRGESPEVHHPAVVASPASGHGSGYQPRYRPNWSPTLVNTPQELAEELRLHWDAAANELTGRPDARMIGFLECFAGLETAIRVIKSAEGPGPKLVRLQGILDPASTIHYRGIPLDDASVSQQIVLGDEGDQNALDWLSAIISEHILTAFAEVSASEHAGRADFLLKKWKDQADAATQLLPTEYQALARRAFRVALPELFSRALRNVNPT